MLHSNPTEPIARWLDDEANTDATVLWQRLRFPYACNVVAPNRVIKSAMSEQLATYNCDDMMLSGLPTPELINLYNKFGDGGFGIIVSGCITVNGKDLEAPGNVIIDENLDSVERRQAFNEWVQATKRNGSIFIAQLFHPGKRAADLPHKTDFDINRLTHQQLFELINEYAYAASYAQQCGFDGVEINCTHYYALGQFITSGSNSRTDEFGGTLRNRARLLYKIIQAIRMRLKKPSNFVVGLKLSYGNFEPGFDEEALGEFIHHAEKTGFDYITITGGEYDLIKDLNRNDENYKPEYFYQQFIINVRKNLTRTKLFMGRGFVTLSEMCKAVSDDLPKRLFAKDVKCAVKSLFDPADYPVEKQFVGTQLWQHGANLKVMDPSNPDHVELFKKELHLHEKQRKINGPQEIVIGYPKVLIASDAANSDHFQDAGSDLEHEILSAYDQGVEIVNEAVKNATEQLLKETAERGAAENVDNFASTQATEQLLKETAERDAAKNVDSVAITDAKPQELYDIEKDKNDKPDAGVNDNIDVMPDLNNYTLPIITNAVVDELVGDGSDVYIKTENIDSQAAHPESQVIAGVNSQNLPIISNVVLDEAVGDESDVHNKAETPEIQVVHSESQVIDDKSDKSDGICTEQSSVDQQQMAYTSNYTSGLADDDVGLSKISSEQIADQLEKPHSHGLAGFISSAIPDSVQNLFTSMRGKMDDNSDTKPTTQVNEQYSYVDPESQSQVHISTSNFESSTVEPSVDGNEVSSRCKIEIETKTEHMKPITDQAECDQSLGTTVQSHPPKDKSGDDDINNILSTATSTSTSTTITTTTTEVVDEHSKSRRLFGHGNDDLDFEFIH